MTARTCSPPIWRCSPRSGLLALVETSNLLQAVAEDYRAVAEILRVQRAWCAAGLAARVDREHLQGVDQDLAPIRDCAKTIIAWIFLRRGWSGGASARDWAHVRGTSPRFRELRGEPNPPRRLDRQPALVFHQERRGSRGPRRLDRCGELVPVPHLGRSRRRAADVADVRERAELLQAFRPNSACWTGPRRSGSTPAWSFGLRSPCWRSGSVA